MEVSRIKLSRALLCVLLPATLALVLACGGKETTPKPAAPAGSSTGSMANPPAGVLDLTSSAKNLQNISSFRFDLSMKVEMGPPVAGGSNSPDAAFATAFLGLLGNLAATGSYVAPDQAEVTLTFFGQEMSYVQIGSKAWEKTGSSWKATVAGNDFAFTPTDIFDQWIPAQVLKGGRVTLETVNGVSATRYSFDKDAMEKFAHEFGDGTNFQDLSEGSLDLWVTDDDLPVKLSLNVTGKDADGQETTIKVEMNIRDLNDASIKIKAPV